VARIAAAQADRRGSKGRSVGGPEDGWPRAVLTHGADEVTVVAGGDRSEFEAFDVDVVDATGAGDAFVAGLIDRWLAGASERDAGIAAGVRFAAAAAAINCTARFTQPGLPDREAVDAFLAERSEGVEGVEGADEDAGD
ncbi:MAG: PfkB family carbohydrate kinase, partial [Methanobacteriota archaeon]